MEDLPMSRAASRFLVVALATLMATAWITARPLPARAAGTISLTTLNTAYTQDFNTLATSGTTNTLAINGWALLEVGTSGAVNQQYAAGTGSSTTGDTYSFGAAASADRALGTLFSGTNTETIGASFTNNTGTTIAKLDVAYTGEMWRAGVTNRGVADRLNFALSTNATSLSSGTWTDYDSLDFNSPNLAAAAGALDGNAALNRTAISLQITGLSIADGATFWIRWSEFDIAPGADDGLGVDDFSLTPRPDNDAAPSVTATSPANDAEDVAVDANVGITFSEPVDVTDPWFDITCDSTGAHTAAVSGGPTTWTLDPDADFAQLENCAVTVDDAGVTDQDVIDPPDTLAADFVFDFQVGPECDDTYTPIYDIQGDGPAAAITGTVDTEGVVVGDFEGSTGVGLNGFYLQDPDGDGDTGTSDGIFVFTGSINNGVAVGDLVRVKGFARDRFPGAAGPGLTSITGAASQTTPVPSAAIRICGEGSVDPTPVTLPWAFAGEQERFEGMLVTFPQDLVIAEYFNYDRFGELVIARPLDGETRPFTPTSIEEPGSAEWAARTLANSLSRITLDDGLGAENPSFTRHPNGSGFSLANRFRGGDSVANTTGVLSFDFGLYRIQPTGAADYTPANPRPPTPEDVGGGIKVAAMNTLNFFLTLDTTASDSGPGPCGGNANLDCRGADASQPLEFDRQRTKLLQALAGLDADVLGLNELENTPGVDPVANIVSGLNVLTAPGTYNGINTGVIGTDAIKVGLVYKPGIVTPVGTFKILNGLVDMRFIDTKSRPALAQTFFVNETGARFTVVVNHLKSKGSACEDVDLDPGPGVDPDNDEGEGQGNCNGTRTLAAEALVDWLAGDPTGSGDPDFLIMGDLNSYAMEDPIDTIKAGADGVAGNGDDFTNLIEMEQGTYAYSYTFDGMAGYLDHALGNASFTAQVTGAADWHINSDEPDLLDYDTSFKSDAQDAIYEPNQYRTSDHDPVIVGLDLTNAAPTFTLVAAASCSSGAGGSFDVTIDDYDLLETELTLELSANTNTTLVPNANATVTGTGANRTISIAAANNEVGTAVLTFTLSDGWNDVDLAITVQVGASGDDVLAGTAGFDILVGGAGEDSLSGLGGVDILCAGHGEDWLDGGDGNDLLEGAFGDDVLLGGGGDDVLRGGVGEDSLTGGIGADSFSGGPGADTNTDLNGGEGDTSDGT
jgi:hypothetical protein